MFRINALKSKKGFYWEFRHYGQLSEYNLSLTGFTLIELIVVIAIIAILSAIIASNVVCVY